MNREVRPVRAVEVVARCDAIRKGRKKQRCGGILEFGGIVLTSNPPQYPHECRVCGHIESLDRAYPTIEYHDDTDD